MYWNSVFQSWYILYSPSRVASQNHSVEGLSSFWSCIEGEERSRNDVTQLWNGKLYIRICECSFPLSFPSTPLPVPPGSLPLYLDLSNRWLCGLCGTVSGESSGKGGGAHSQTKLAENGKPFRRSPLFCIRFLLPCPALVPNCRTFPPSLLWPLFSLPFLQLSPHGHHPCYTKSSVLSTAHSLLKHFFVFDVGLALNSVSVSQGSLTAVGHLDTSGAAENNTYNIHKGVSNDNQQTIIVLMYN